MVYMCSPKLKFIKESDPKLVVFSGLAMKKING
jgi:hypothetical protein